jgi:hypothetical protein
MFNCSMGNKEVSSDVGSGSLYSVTAATGMLGSISLQLRYLMKVSRIICTVPLEDLLSTTCFIACKNSALQVNRLLSVTGQLFRLQITNSKRRLATGEGQGL